MSPEQEIAAVLAGEKRYAVLHGDCLDLLELMPRKCGVCALDPPYGVGKNIAGDKLPWEQWLPWLDARLIECNRVGRLTFAFFSATKLIRFVRETTVPPQMEINWHKPMMLHDTSLNGSPFLAHREAILYWGPMSPKEAGKLGYDSFAVNALWPRERRKLGLEHPTPKPLGLMLQTLPRWTTIDDIVIDPFCGEGTTLVAGLRLGRRVIGIDIDCRWVDASIRRIEAELAHTSVGDAARGQSGLWVPK